MPTHKKGHDKDKYYHLAKDQGYRSRAAFKLIQINKRFDFLSKAKVTVDLCAAPGGWCQVAAKFMPAGSIVLGVDLLPIKAIRNVKTIVSDITTAECRRLVSSELQGWKADVVLCDGAPNIGSAYEKDAYVQNELILSALKTATDHLVKGGTFCAKVYRSKDYNALMWVLHQLFEDIQVMKPNSSRSQSSEIFVVCLKYTAPNKIDPKLLDPNHVFKEVADPGLVKVDVLHKNYEKHNKRNRAGYDESYGITLTKAVSVAEFIHTKDAIRMISDVNTLTFTDQEEDQKYKSHPLTTPEIITCFEDLRVLGKIDFKKILKWRLAMKKSNEAETSTTAEDVIEVKENISLEPSKMSEEDIQDEIAGLRSRMLQQEKKEKKKDRIKARKERDRQGLGMHNNAFELANEVELFSLLNTTVDDVEDIGDIDLNTTEWEDVEDEDEKEGEADGNNNNKNNAIFITDNNLEAELEEDYIRYMRSRQAKKEGSITDLAKLDAREEGMEEGRTVTAKRVRLARTPTSLLAKKQEEDEEVMNTAMDIENYVHTLTGGGEAENDSDSDDEEEEEEEENSQPLLEEKEDGTTADSTAKHAKTKAKQPRTKGSQMVVTRDKAPLSLRAAQFFSHPLFQETLITERDIATTATSTDTETATGGAAKRNSKANKQETEMESDSEMRTDETTEQQQEEDEEDDNITTASSSTMQSSKSKAAKLMSKKQHPTGLGTKEQRLDPLLISANAIQTLNEMPKTDKEKRQEKRKKSSDRLERKQKRLLSDIQEDDDIDNSMKKLKNRKSNTAGFEIDHTQDDDDTLQPLSSAEIARRKLIKDGLGNEVNRATVALQLHNSKSNPSKIEYISNDSTAFHSSRKGLSTTDDDDALEYDSMSENDDGDGDSSRRRHPATTTTSGALKSGGGAGLPSRVDTREYNSEDENYDAHDKAMTLALGTMMLRKSRQKAMVDASYNRFAWNDPNDLPDWFMDDEMRHNKPLLPVPHALLTQIKSKFQTTGTKDIGKVAEARARKRKRALSKLKAAKNQANLMANNSDMSDKQKIRAISKAMKVSKVNKPSKVYVVTKKTGSGGSMGTAKGGKGRLKFVDKRMKKEKRAVKAKAKRGKK